MPKNDLFGDKFDIESIMKIIKTDYNKEKFYNDMYNIDNINTKFNEKIDKNIYNTLKEKIKYNYDPYSSTVNPVPTPLQTQEKTIDVIERAVMSDSSGLSVEDLKKLRDKLADLVKTVEVRIIETC